MKKATQILPTNDTYWLQYLAACHKAYGYVNFLTTGVENRVNVLSAPPTDRIYVVPNFCDSYIDPQFDPTVWDPVMPLDDLLNGAAYKKLFIKGDPGIGKTTMLRRIAHVLSDPSKRAFREQMGHPIPFLATLREGVFRQVKSWKEFLKAIFQQPHFKNTAFLPSKINAVFASGQAFLLLDGLDEVTDPDQRKRLKDILLEGMEKYPDGRFWVTTRIVGFDQLEFWLGKKWEAEVVFEKGFRGLHREGGILGKHKMQELLDPVDLDIKFEHDFDPVDTGLQKLGWARGVELERLKVSVPHFKETYIAPFDNPQLERFMSLWFDMVEPLEHLRPEKVRHFVDSVLSHPHISHLARIPNLLTMMALYHRINQSFPDGRYELYDKIIEAYLKIIRQQKGMPPFKLEYPYLRKCLAALAAFLQEKRTGDRKKDALLTASRKEGETKFEETLKGILRGSSQEERKEKIDNFFDGLTLHSDILMPRADDEYGFLHLSIQEFLTAEHYQQRYAKLRKEEERETYWAALKEKAMKPGWTETMVLYFEGFKAIPDRMAEDCLEAFEKITGWDCKTGKTQMSNLASQVMMDEYICELFTEKERWDVLGPLAHTYFIYKKHDITQSEYSENLIEWAAKNGLYYHWTKDAPPPAQEVTKIRWFSAEKECKDISFLASFINLQVLYLSSTQVSDVSPLAKLTNLSVLYLRSTQVVDVSPLAKLTNLSVLDLSSTQVVDVSPLAKLTNLSVLDLRSTQVVDVSPLAKLTNLNRLYLRSTQVVDVSPLAKLTNLRELDLRSTQVVDVSPLAKLTNLRELDLRSTQVNEAAIKRLKKTLPKLQIIQEWLEIPF